MASKLITTENVIQHVETTLKATDSELGRLIDSADSAIIKTYGPHVRVLGNDDSLGNAMPRTVTVDNENYQHRIYLPYPPAESESSITSISEYASYELPSKAKALVWDSSNDHYKEEDVWVLEYGGRVIRRVQKRFNAKVNVTYTPVDDSSDRIHILIDLVRLADRFDAVRSEEFGIGRSGGAAVEYADYLKEWNRILNRARPFTPGIAFV